MQTTCEYSFEVVVTSRLHPLSIQWTRRWANDPLTKPFCSCVYLRPCKLLGKRLLGASEQPSEARLPIDTNLPARLTKLHRLIMSSQSNLDAEPSIHLPRTLRTYYLTPLLPARAAPSFG
ncbi:hypothetical protein NMY22_g13763 [Coprinellus aureogranulatus]|nr:hypothetical protein NMY22_g13763 [Coprinellus aureogranulatus]